MSGTNSIPEMPFRADCEEHAGLRGLDRRDALLALRVRTFVREELGVDWRGARLLLSLSGGIDSTALLCLLLALRPLENLTLAAAHLDHCLRPESGDDAAYVRALCAAWEIPLHERKEDIRARAQAGAIGEEEAGRTARRAFLAETASLIHADWVLLAHHADDLAEDILMRLMRGAAWPGLGGMRGCDPAPGLPLLRPLLMEEKASLRGLLERLHVPWREDATNSERIGRRNRIRLDVLPMFKAENPAFLDVARRMWRSARQDERYWRDLLDEIFDESRQGAESAAEEAGGLLLPGEKLLSLPEGARLRAYRFALERMALSFPLEAKGGIQARHAVLFALDRALREKRHGKRFLFSGGLQAELSSRGVYFCLRKQPVDDVERESPYKGRRRRVFSPAAYRADP